MFVLSELFRIGGRLVFTSVVDCADRCWLVIRTWF